MEKIFRGVYTAIITPFNKLGKIDWKSLEELVEFNIQEDVEGIVPCGTTGESPTLSHGEHNEVIKQVVKFVNGRAKVIAGTGSNCTREAIEMTEEAERNHADGVLLVNPYYNKPTQEGLYRHFIAIASSTSLPIVLYNIPGRTGVNLEPSTLLRLIENAKNIVGIKEASGNLAQINEIIRIGRLARDNFSILSGDDNLTFEIIKSGGDGVISVASNIIPGHINYLVNEALAGRYDSAGRENSYLENFFKALFYETNPIPIKWMLHKQRKIEPYYRLPLCEPSEENKKKIEKVMKEYELI